MSLMILRIIFHVCYRSPPVYRHPFRTLPVCLYELYHSVQSWFDLGLILVRSWSDLGPIAWSDLGRPSYKLDQTFTVYKNIIIVRTLQQQMFDFQYNLVINSSSN